MAATPAEPAAAEAPKAPPTVNEWMDDVINRMNSLYGRLDLNITHVMSGYELINIMKTVQNVFMEESSLCECEAPIKVVGDTHAQYQDLNRLFDLVGRVPQEKFCFLGDYVDRGPQGIEILTLLFALKVRYPDRIYLLRGNHETASVNKIYGFYNECAQKYGVGIWWDFQCVFNRMPMAGLISKKVLCMHGGLSPEIASLDTIRNIFRPCEPLDKGLLIDLLWSDPTNKGDGWFHSIRGISYSFGRGVVEQFCSGLGIDLIIRAHQVVQDGYELMAGRHLITVFSVPNYCCEFTNAAAVVCLDHDLTISFQQLQMGPPTPIPGKKLPKAAPSIACSVAPETAKEDKDFIKPFTGFKQQQTPQPLLPKPSDVDCTANDRSVRAERKPDKKEDDKKKNQQDDDLKSEMCYEGPDTKNPQEASKLKKSIRMSTTTTSPKTEEKK